MRFAPVTAAASSEARKATASATSLERPDRGRRDLRGLGRTPPSMSPGETMLTVMPFATSETAAVRVRMSRPVLATA